MTAITPCDGGCGTLIDALNESFDHEPTALIDGIVDPFTEVHWDRFFCGFCADRLYPGWREEAAR